jgi:Effector-associated domain 2/Trypsin-like peptidase domain
MNATQRARLVEALLPCPSMGNRNTRDTIIGDLDEDIQRNIQRSTADRDDVANVVKSCLNYSNGLEELVAVVRRYEGGSIPMEAVDRLILDIYDFDIRESATPMHARLLATVSNIDLSSDELKQVYRSILPTDVKATDEPLGLFAITGHLWNLSLRPEGQRPDRTYPFLDWIEELARRTEDSSLASELRRWSSKMAPELDQNAKQRLHPDQPTLAGEGQAPLVVDRRLTILASVLSFHYPTMEASGEIVASARLNPVKIRFRENASLNWQDILNEAHRQGKVASIIEAALSQHPEDDWLVLAQKEQEQVELEAALEAAPAGPEDASLERIISHESELLPVAFFELGLQKARSVARVVLPGGRMASGFLTDGNLLITCNHVLPTAAEAKEAVIQFNYQRGIDALYAQAEEFKLLPEEAFVTSPPEEDDWTAVRVQGNAVERWGAISLKSTDPKVDDRAILIGHPYGEPKQISLFYTISAVDARWVQYVGSTYFTSSGALILNTDWRPVALHRQGGLLLPTRQFAYQNEGIRTNVIAAGLVKAGLIPEPSPR